MSSAAEVKTESSGASGGGGNKLVLILTLVNLVVTVGMVGVLFVSFKRDSTKPQVGDINAHAEASAEKPKGGEAKGEGEGEGKAEGGAKEKAKSAEFGRMITLDQFTVNLTSPGASAPRFVRVNVSLEVPNEETESEVNAKVPQVRNAVIDLFNSKHPSDLATAEGRDGLKDEIKNALNGFLTRGKVKGVFFTNFVLGS
jgi:flagellar protein FliL